MSEDASLTPLSKRKAKDSIPKSSLSFVPLEIEADSKRMERLSKARILTAPEKAILGGEAGLKKITELKNAGANIISIDKKTGKIEGVKILKSPTKSIKPKSKFIFTGFKPRPINIDFSELPAIPTHTPIIIRTDKDKKEKAGLPTFAFYGLTALFIGYPLYWLYKQTHQPPPPPKARPPTGPGINQPFGSPPTPFIDPSAYSRYPSFGKAGITSAELDNAHNLIHIFNHTACANYLIGVGASKEDADTFCEVPLPQSSSSTTSPPPSTSLYPTTEPTPTPTYSYIAPGGSKGPYNSSSDAQSVGAATWPNGYDVFQGTDGKWYVKQAATHGI